MDFESLSPELKAKALECASPEELVALAKEVGIELSDEQLDAVAGGEDWTCGSANCDSLCTDNGFK